MHGHSYVACWHQDPDDPISEAQRAELETNPYLVYSTPSPPRYVVALPRKYVLWSAPRVAAELNELAAWARED